MGDCRKKKEKVAILLRVSSDDQVDTESLNTQKSNAMKRIDSSAHDLVKSYSEEGNSAYIKDDDISFDYSDFTKEIVIKVSLKKRPVFCEMLMDAKAGIFKRLMFYKWNRFSRNTIHCLGSIGFLKNLGVKLQASNDANEPDFIPALLSIFSQKLVEDLSNSKMDSQRNRFEQGFFPDKAPYGYLMEKSPDGGSIASIMVVNEEAKDVIKMFRTRLSGMKVADACRKVMKNKYKKDSDGKIISVKRVSIAQPTYWLHINNKKYAGYIEFDGVEKLGKYKPIIPLEVWETAQAVKYVEKMNAETLKAFDKKRKEMISKLDEYAKEIVV